MPRYAARTDANQNEIAAALIQTGFIVSLTFRLGGGFPDMVVTDPATRRAYLVEVKANAKSKLTKAEKEFAERYDYALPWLRIHSAEEFIEVMNKERTK
jgi:hypothetical protein